MYTEQLTSSDQLTIAGLRQRLEILIQENQPARKSARGRFSLSRITDSLYPSEERLSQSSLLLQQLDNIQSEVTINLTDPLTLLAFKQNYNHKQLPNNLLAKLESAGINLVVDFLNPNQITNNPDLAHMISQVETLESRTEKHGAKQEFKLREALEFAKIAGVISTAFYSLGNLDEFAILGTLNNLNRIFESVPLEQFEHMAHTLIHSDLWHEYAKYIFNLYTTGQIIRSTNIQSLFSEGSVSRQVTGFVANNTKLEFNSIGDGQRQARNAFFLWMLNKFLHTPFVH